MQVPAASTGGLAHPVVASVVPPRVQSARSQARVAQEELQEVTSRAAAQVAALAALVQVLLERLAQTRVPATAAQVAAAQAALARPQEAPHQAMREVMAVRGLAVLVAALAVVVQGSQVLRVPTVPAQVAALVVVRVLGLPQVGMEAQEVQEASSTQHTALAAAQALAVVPLRQAQVRREALVDYTVVVVVVEDTTMV